MFSEDLVYAPLVRVQQLLGTGVGDAELCAHGLNRFVEDLLNARHAEALVREILRIVIVVELTCSALVVEVVKAGVIIYRYQNP